MAWAAPMVCAWTAVAMYIRLLQVAYGFYRPLEKRLGKVPAPEGIRFANLAFGEPDRKTLYLVSAKNLWRLRYRFPA